MPNSQGYDYDEFNRPRMSELRRSGTTRKLGVYLLLKLKCGVQHPQRNQQQQQDAVGGHQIRSLSHLDCFICVWCSLKGVSLATDQQAHGKLAIYLPNCYV